MHRTKLGLVCFIVIIFFVLALIQPAYSAGLALDGSGSNYCGTPCSATLTTTNANDVIVVFAVSTGASFGGMPVASGLSFKVRDSTTFGPHFVGEWWAIASTPLVAETVKVTTTSGSAIGLVVWGVSGANTGSPFDPSLASPATSSSLTPNCSPGPTCSVPISVTIPSTSNANDMILGMAGDDGGLEAYSAGSGGFSLIAAGAPAAAAEYKIVSSTKSSLPVPMTLNNDGGITVWVMFGDAVQTATTPPLPIPEYPFGLALLAVLAVICYGVIRHRTRT